LVLEWFEIQIIEQMYLPMFHNNNIMYVEPLNQNRFYVVFVKFIMSSYTILKTGVGYYNWYCRKLNVILLSFIIHYKQYIKHYCIILCCLICDTRHLSVTSFFGQNCWLMFYKTHNQLYRNWFYCSLVTFQNWIGWCDYWAIVITTFYKKIFISYVSTLVT